MYKTRQAHATTCDKELRYNKQTISQLAKIERKKDKKIIEFQSTTTCRRKKELSGELKIIRIIRFSHHNCINLDKECITTF